MAIGNPPIGTIIAWENAAIPSGWAICDGNNGTPDLRGRFVRGAAADGDIRVTGGADTHTHTNPNTGTRSAHNHGGSKSGGVSGGGAQWVTSGSGASSANKSHSHGVAVGITGANVHSHTVGATNNASTIPQYIKRVFIRRIS